MATKTQAKAAIDAAVILVKADIDNILPVGVNIKDGDLALNPNRWNFILDAGGVTATGDSWFATIQANLTTAARPFTTDQAGRRLRDGIETKFRRINSDLASYLIINMG